MDFAVTIALICLAVAWHELGHFAAARALGFPVHYFGVGFGPGLEFRFASTETVFRLGLIPLGGYVALPPEAGRGVRGALISFAGPLFSLGLGMGLLGLACAWTGDDAPAVLLGVSKAVVSGLASLFRSGIHDLVGPVGMVRQGAKMATSGLNVLVYFAVVNIGLGSFNLLPFPPLDGWGVLFGSWLPKRLNAVAVTVGAAAMVALLVVVTMRDLWP